MNRAYLRLISTAYGLGSPVNRAVLKRLDLFVSNNSFAFAAALKLYMALAAAAIFLLGEKLSLTFLSKVPVLSSFHNLILTIILMAHYDADTPRD